ncbi:hypothetical protein FGL83_05615 [Leuconostoc lactis]|uniref:DUF1149 family protein n=1 Tax=Leuconostoc lactis TaxID=1246 RepID=A0AAP9ECK4_LEULA|nr:hypothetical protein [Leuconostoc lactis]QEA44170.1 hypothetical protein FGL83_05615 [Leuconostoc lactis]
MNISYKFFYINNLTYKFDQNNGFDVNKFSEAYNFNIKSTVVNVNRNNSAALIELEIALDTKLESIGKTFRSLSFDFYYGYQMEDFEELSDEDIQNFIIENGLASAVSAIKDVVKNITSIDYQPTINIDIPKFPISTSKQVEDN